MKKKKIRDFTISCFLISSILLAAFLVSCSEDDGFMIGPNLSGNDPNFGAGTSSSPMAAIFLSLGKGAASEVGGELAGWTLSAMGLSSASGSSSQHQMNQIIDELQDIVATLADMDSTLSQINSSIQHQTCVTAVISVNDAISRIKSSYTPYKSYVHAGSQGDTVPNATLKDWADKVLAINAYAGATSIDDDLNEILTNMEGSASIISNCIPDVTIPAEGSIGTDTAYYNQVLNIANYYYYWQTVALTLISEAEHYYAWVDAGSPGGTYTSSDSIQKVCDDNVSSGIHCNNVAISTNDLYNGLLTQQTQVGWPYTGEYLNYQHFDAGPVVWVKSLEAFTSEAGYNCNSPLTNTSPCGPTAGYYYAKLNDSVHWNTSASFRFAKGSELRNLIDVSKVGSMTNGQYLQTQGFEHMSGKTIIASDSVQVYPDYTGYSSARQTIVPFFNTDIGPINNGHSYESVIYTQNDLQGILLHAVHEGNRDGTCGGNNSFTSKLYHYHYNSQLGALESWVVTYAKTRICNNSTPVTDFEYTDHNYNGSNCCLPGYLTSQQRKGTPGKRYLFPMFLAYTAKCTNNRGNTTANGIPTMCGDDFTAILKTNVPRPESCDIKNVGTTCTELH